MTEKDSALAAISALPPDATLADCLRELAFTKMVEDGLRDARAGRHMSTDELRQALSTWRR